MYSVLRLASLRRRACCGRSTLSPDRVGDLAGSRGRAASARQAAVFGRPLHRGVQRVRAGQRARRPAHQARGADRQRQIGAAPRRFLARLCRCPAARAKLADERRVAGELRRRAVGRRAVRGRRSRNSRTSLAIQTGQRPRAARPRPQPRRAQQAERRARTRRRRRSTRIRATPSSITPSGRSTSGCGATRKRPTPIRATSTCCRTRIAARRRRGRAPKCASCARSASRPPLNIDAGVGRQAAHRAVPRLNEKIIVKARVNRGPQMDFVLDTGSEQTVISRETAARMGIRPIVNILSAGVGDLGVRELELTRLDELEIGSLKVHNVPSIIKNPPLVGLPTREMESFSPLALGHVGHHRLRPAGADHGRRAAERNGRHRAAAADASARDGAGTGAGRAGELHPRHRRPGHLDQHRHGERPRARRDAEHPAQGVRRVGMGSRRVPDAGRQPELHTRSSTRICRSSC